MRISRIWLAAFVTAAVAGCGSGDSPPKLACDLLTADEVSEAVGRQVYAVNSSAGDDSGSCSYFDQDVTFAFGIDVVWSGGLSQWEILSTARKLAPQYSEDAAVTEDLVKAGPVKGLGDAAWYNELIGSHVLVGDTLVGFKVVLLPEPAKQFRPLAEKVVARLRE